MNKQAIEQHRLMEMITRDLLVQVNNGDVKSNEDTNRGDGFWMTLKRGFVTKSVTFHYKSNAIRPNKNYYIVLVTRINMDDPAHVAHFVDIEIDHVWADNERLTKLSLEVRSLGGDYDETYLQRKIWAALDEVNLMIERDHKRAQKKADEMNAIITSAGDDSAVPSQLQEQLQALGCKMN